MMLIHMLVVGAVLTNFISEAAIARLPTHIIPEQYFIELEPDFVNDTFQGNVTIEFRVVEQSQNITLHAYQIEFNVSNVYLSDQNLTASSVTISDGDDHFCVIALNGTLEVDQTYNLTIQGFTGILNSDKFGFYLAKYNNQNGTEVKLATTQFEAVYARRAFPCFDEPGYKANFTLSIIRPENYTSVSNQPAANTTEAVGDGRYKDTFEKTPKMSTYLLAFIVSDFKFTEQLGIHRVLARSEEIDAGKAEYALETGNQALEAIEKFVDVPYNGSISKMDQAAIPDDYFYFGAMENWGLVTYREVVLLYSNVTSLASQKQKIATIIAHEFGHQWFGNLVTPTWWEYVWLNEGFATYFEYYATSLVEADWDIMNQFTVRILQYALQGDSLNTTRAMNMEPDSNANVMDYFDNVAYNKAGSVVRMIETFLTTPVFKSGLNKYLSKMQYSNAEPEDLYASLQEAVNEANATSLLPEGHNVSTVLGNWASSVGYPVVNVELDYSNNTVTFSQSRFLLKNASEDSSFVWFIPINYALENNYNFSDLSTDFWLTNSSVTVELSNLNSSEWIIVNKQERGYYRVNYDTANWNNIINYLINNHTNIDKVNRAQLIDDAFNLARSGRLNYEITFDLSTYLKNETDYVPFYSFFTALSFLDTELTESEKFNTFKKFIIEILGGIFETLGANLRSNDSHLDVLNRINTLTWLCRYGHEYCRGNATELLHSWKNSSVIIPPDLQAPYFCGAMATADEEHWDFLFSQYENATEAALKTRILNGLGCSENTTILEKYLNKTVDSSNSLSSSDRTTAFASVYNAGKIGLSYALTYTKERIADIDSTILTTILSGISAKVTTSAQLDELEMLIANNNLTDVNLSSAEENIKWLDDHENEINSYLDSYDNANDTTTVGTTSDGPGTTSAVTAESTSGEPETTTSAVTAESTSGEPETTTSAVTAETTTGEQTTPSAANLLVSCHLLVTLCVMIIAKN